MKASLSFKSFLLRKEIPLKGPLDIIVMNITTNIEVEFTLRALQLIFAIIVMGTDGHGMANVAHFTNVMLILTLSLSYPRFSRPYCL